MSYRWVAMRRCYPTSFHKLSRGGYAEMNDVNGSFSSYRKVASMK